jgi:hypothetical protein
MAAILDTEIINYLLCPKIGYTRTKVLEKETRA